MLLFDESQNLQFERKGFVIFNRQWWLLVN